MEATTRSHSLILALLIHGAVFLLLFLVVMQSAIPPFGQQSGAKNFLVDISELAATSTYGLPLNNPSVVSTPVQNGASTSQPDRSVATQDFEPSPIIQKQDPAAIAATSPIVTESITNRNTSESQQAVIPNAIYRGRTATGTPQGTRNSGSNDGTNQSGTSVYQREGGIGSIGPVGPDKLIGLDGSYKGGISAFVDNRNMILTPNIEDRTQETGKVVVGISVDKSGYVVAANPGYRGSTTTSSYLFSKAKEAAMKARFNPSDDGADIQKGTITFVFVVQ